MDKRTFGVMLIGFSPHDERVLTSTLRLTAHRSRSYEIVASSADRAVEIVLVDADVLEAIAQWRGYLERNPAAHSVLVTSKQMSGPHYYLNRPIVANRLLRTLDQLTINELKFFPEMVVTESQPADALRLDAMAQTGRTDANKPPARFKALVVDDSAAIRKLMELELRISDFAIDFATTAVQAAACLAVSRYDIVFLDVTLPDGDGYQISKTIKHDKQKKHTPVIMLTGRSGAFDRVRGKLSGCDAYIVKPASHETLQKIINQYVHTPAARASRA